MTANRINRQFRLAARPQGMVKESDLAYAEAPVPEPAADEVLVKTSHISLDPSMRGQMENRADYVAPLQIGDVMRAGGAGTVVASNRADLAVGTLVTGSFGMQDYCLSNGRDIPLRRFPAGVDAVTALGVLGGTGMTAFFGMLELGQPRQGNTVVVSGAAGATGSIAGQIARLKGCRVIGIAGSPDKCRWLVDDLGFDAAINYKTQNVGEELDRLCPQGIDVYFDNVGGEILDACLARIAMHARVVICGGISRYNTTGPIPGPRNYFNLVYRRARMEGFIVIDYASRFDQAAGEMKQWIDAGLIRHRATVIDGFTALPKALVQLFSGVNTGKLLVKTD
ncbi:MAG: NADP-dependent oxidoreductase [Pseudomonadales bacterium]|nr:NADP-dependent oxidoreductase [Pseudomonadales bacterium]MCP5185144.1 NADP-dependent oxidoreductase [Pseudomonadales bacterium]